MWLSSEQAGTTNLLAHTSQYITGVTEHCKDNGEIYISGVIGANYRAIVSLSGLSLKGSLARYYLDDNYQTLTRSDSGRAIEMIADELHLPIDKAKVTRIDFAQNFLMTYKPESYYNYLGECQYYQRLSQPNSLYYSNGLRTKLFYNKVEEGKRKRQSLPEVWNDQNVLRYEMRFSKRLPSQLGIEEVNAVNLPNGRFVI